MTKIGIVYSQDLISKLNSKRFSRIWQIDIFRTDSRAHILV